MAKRKRLSAANPIFLDGPEPPSPDRAASASRAPIADVAGDSSASAALEEVAAELTLARETGRMIVQLPLDQIELGYLVRDRLLADDDEMEALVTSIRDRGQQTPIEVTRLDNGRYGLISGWRRCQALTRLQERGEGNGLVLALERRPENASDAYRAMIEENEIRVGLSYFERARIVDVAVEQGVFESHKKALQTLFAAASRAKRSKIGSFIIVVQVLGLHLVFPQALGERLGLRLARLIDLYPDKAQDLRTACAVNRVETPEEEQAFLTAWVATAEAEEKGADALAAGRAKPARPAQDPRPAPVESQPRAGLVARFHAGENRLELSGTGLTEDLRAALMDWLAAQDG